MGNEPLDAPDSQGLINDPKGQVDQQFGDRQTANTGGGDYGGEIIDKRQYTFINLFGADSMTSTSPQFLRSIVSALDLVADKQSVSRAYQNVLPPDADVSRPRATTFEEMVHQLEEFRRLPQFLQQIVGDLNVPEEIRKQLEELQLQLAGDTQKTPQKDLISHDSSILQTYLQIVLRPERNSDKLVVNAWLISDDGMTNQAKHHQPLDLDRTRKGAACEIKAVPTILNQFLDQALQYLAGQRYQLTLEVFLPLNHLCADVDSWELTDLFFEEDTYLVGTKYPVIVRSQERLDPRYLASRLNQWHTNWDRVKLRLLQVPGPHDFEDLSNMDTCNWKQLGKALKQKLGLKLTCGLMDTTKKELFTCILKAASPIAIWPRQELPDLKHVEEIDQLIAAGPLLKLLETLRQKREDADCADCPGTHIGSHLALLWENPNRLTPDALAQLRPPGQ